MRERKNSTTRIFEREVKQENSSELLSPGSPPSSQQLAAVTAISNYLLPIIIKLILKIHQLHK